MLLCARLTIGAFLVVGLHVCRMLHSIVFICHRCMHCTHRLCTSTQCSFVSVILKYHIPCVHILVCIPTLCICHLYSYFFPMAYAYILLIHIHLYMLLLVLV